MLYLDFETRGTVDLRKVGATRYAIDPATQVLCMCWQYDDEPGGTDSPVHLWHRDHPWANKSPRPDELLERIASGELVEAHNAGFEYRIWLYVLMREFPEFDVPLLSKQMRCSAAKASCLSLPRALGDAAKALNLGQRKDPDGNRLINKLSKPVPKRGKKAVEPGVQFCEEEIEHRRNHKYCQQDVRTERALSDDLPEMTERELEYWQMDWRMNLRGITLDQESATEAVELCRQEADRLNAELRGLTEGVVEKGSQRIRFLKWINGEMAALGITPLLNTKADTISFALYGVPTKAGDEAKQARKSEMDAGWAKLGDRGARLHRAFEICLEVNRSSVAKYRQMVASVCPDGRLHDIMLYNGADRTGRWPLSGDHEILTPRGWVRLDKWNDEDQIAQWEHIKGRSGRISFGAAERIESLYTGEMVRMKSANTELFCTTGHKIPQVNERGGLRDLAAEDVTKCSYWAVPCGGVYVGSFESSDITRAIVMFQADGSIKHGQPGTHFTRTKYVLGFTKPRKIERCRALLNTLHIPFKEYNEHCGNFAVRFYIDADDAPEWLKLAKQFGPWLLEHDPVVFIDELKHWDGSTDKRNINPGTSYSTCSKNNAEWVQTLAALAGTRANIEDRGVRNPHWHRSYRVHVHSRGARLGLKSGWSFSREPSPGKVYCARTQTGYFLVRYNGTIQVTGNSGQGVQPHNFVRGYQADMGLPVLADKDRPEFGYKLPVWDVLKTLDLDYITLLEGPALPALARACRGALIASPGKELYAADFKAIEARKLAWLAGCKSMLHLFQSGGDPYLAMATGIYKREITKADKTERQVGKKAVLGLGYAMGWEKFQFTVWMEEGIWLDDDFCKLVVRVYRFEQAPEVPLLWKAAEKAAITAVQEGGEWPAGGDELGVGAISYFVDGRFLHCRLPSGRLLAYLDPEVHTKVNYRFAATHESRDAAGNIVIKPCLVAFPAKMGVPMSRVIDHAKKQAEKQRKILTGDAPESFLSPHLSFMGRNIVTKQWQRCGTHGGSLTENFDQASSRDLLAESMFRVDAEPDFDLLLSIHDEVIAEAPIGTATVREFEGMVSEVPLWAPGMPIEAEGWVGPRLRK